MRFIVDGMNVIGSRPDGWWRDRHGAMLHLVAMLERWAAGSGDDVTVVFEAPPRPPIRSTVIVVAHARRAGSNSADDEIVRLMVAADDAHDVRVVTSDGWLADRVRGAGAGVRPARAFRDEIDPA